MNILYCFKKIIATLNILILLFLTTSVSATTVEYVNQSVGRSLKANTDSIELNGYPFITFEVTVSSLDGTLHTYKALKFKSYVARASVQCECIKDFRYDRCLTPQDAGSGAIFKYKAYSEINLGGEYLGQLPFRFDIKNWGEVIPNGKSHLDENFFKLICNKVKQSLPKTIEWTPEIEKQLNAWDMKKCILNSETRIYTYITETLSNKLSIRPNSLELDRLEWIPGNSCLATYYTPYGTHSCRVNFDKNGVVFRADCQAGQICSGTCNRISAFFE